MRDWEEQGVRDLALICAHVDVVPLREKHSRSYSFLSPGFIKNYYSREMYGLIHKKLREVDFDILQFEYLPMAQYINGFNKRAFITEHQLGYLYLKKEMLVEENTLRKAILYFRYRRLFHYETRTLRRFDKVIFISNKEAEEIREGGPFVSPMGVDAEYFKPDDEAEDTDLIYIGNFDNYQNKDTVIYFYKTIWPLIKKMRPKTNLKILGYKSKEHVGFLEYDDGIEVMGYVRDIRGYVAKARLYIVPARIGAGMRGKLLEALSMKKTVLSTSIGAEGYSGDVLRAIAIVDRPEEFAHKAVEILDDKGCREYMGNIGREVVAGEYKWQSVFSRMDNLYDSLS